MSGKAEHNQKGAPDEKAAEQTPSGSGNTPDKATQENPPTGGPPPAPEKEAKEKTLPAEKRNKRSATYLYLLILFGAMAAWVICRNKAKWSTVIYMIFISSMIIPFQVVMLPLVATFREAGNFVGLSMNGSIPGLIFAYCGFGGAMTVFILTGFIKGVPYELEEAAAIDGCSPEGTFFRIIFPLLKPVITTVTILNGMWIWNDYLLPSILLGQSSPNKTLPVAVQAFVGSFVKSWDLILTAALLAMLPMIIVFLIAQKQIMSGMVEGAIK